jgi:hypothetical protein
MSVGINDEGTTPTRARLNVLADVRSHCWNRYIEMQRRCCTILCVRKVDVRDGRAAEETLQKRVFRVRVKDHPAGGQ